MPEHETPAASSSTEAAVAPSWWVRLCRWLWRGLLFVWGTLVLGIVVGTIANLNTTTTDTPLSKLYLIHVAITYPLPTTAVIGTLLLLTAISWIGSRGHDRTARVSPSHQNRWHLLRRLRFIYDQMMTDSLQNTAWLELGLTSKPDAVQNASALLLRTPTQPERLLPATTSIVEVYEQANHELLILGEPGTGKSTLLMRLAQHLVEQAEQDVKCPLPIYLPLSSWAVKRLPLQEWLSEQFSLMYDVPRWFSQHWVREEVLVLLLDGLDEMEVSTCTACIAAINAYHHDHLHPLVICSRTEEYAHAAAPERLALQYAVVVQALTPAQVDAYLVQAGKPLAALRAALRKNSTLAALATTSLMLHILMLTYQGTSVRQLSQKEALLRQQIWADYVQHMVSRKGDVKRYPPHVTITRLGWLARKMRQRNQTIFYLEQLQPDWLPLGRLQRKYEMFAVRLPGILIGVLVSMLVNALLFYAGDTFTNVQDLFLSGLVGGLLGGSSGAQLPFSVIDRSWKARLHVAWKSKRRSLLLIGLSFGLLFGVVGGLSLGIPWYENLRIGVISGISTGLVSVTLGLLIETDKALNLQEMPAVKAGHLRTQQLAIIRHISFGAFAGLLAGFCVGLSVGLDGAARFGGNFGVSLGLDVGLSEGLHFGIISLMLSLLLFGMRETIEPSEIIIWSVKRFEKSLIKKRHLINTLYALLLVGLLTWLSGGLGFGLSIGLKSGLNSGLINGLGFGLSDTLNAGLSAGLSAGLAYWILLGLWNGISHETLSDQHRVLPNQGIRNSGRNSLLIGLTVGGFSWLIGFLSNMLVIVLSGRQITELSIAISEGAIIGVAGGLLSGLLTGGGLAWYRHYILRHLLELADVIPRNYVRFLDEATTRILLRRVGGGYSFTHRLLLDYFADLDAHPSLPSTAEPSTPSSTP